MPNELENILQNTNSNKVAGLYDIGQTIGKGHFAVVKEARHVFTQEKVAIKIIDKTKLDKISRDQLLSEVMCMKLVQHPNIIRLYEVIDTVNKLYLVLELGDGGDLYDYLLTKGNNGLSDEEAKHYFRQILRALAYCHKLHVVHRDIKPENVVFFKQSELVKLTDFGFSNKFIPGETLKTSCGSLAYSAPEILLGDSYDAPKVDIWSLGVILFMLVTGTLPFNETNDSETIANIMDCKYTVPDRVSDACRNLIGKLLKRDASQRASLDLIMNDEWLRFNHSSLEYEIETYSIPLISQEHLSLEEHIEILTKMRDGNLASIEETQKILDSGSYNHISATYFLLAERKMKRKYVDKYIQLKLKHKCEQLGSKEDLALNFEKSKAPSNGVKQISMEASRRISMILEGEETEEIEEIDAMTSLATVRRELEAFMDGSEVDRQFSGSSAPNPSRCVSRISSVYDLYSISDDYDSDTGLMGPQKIRRSMHKSFRSFSSFTGASITARDTLPEEPVSRDRSSRFTKRITVIGYRPGLRKSHSVSELGVDRHSVVGFEIEDLTSELHKFNAASAVMNNGRRSSCSSKYAAVQMVAMNELRLGPALFEFSAPCSTPDLSDTENDPRPGKPRWGKLAIRKVDSRLSDTFDHHDICGPIDEEDEHNRPYALHLGTGPALDRPPVQPCFRSRSFDGRLSNLIQPEPDPETERHSSYCRAIAARKQDNLSWHTNSINRRLTDSNFSLSSYASKLDQPNMMQLIRGTYELHMLSMHDHSDGTKSPFRTSSCCPSELSPAKLLSETPILPHHMSAKPSSASSKFRKSRSKFKLFSLFSSSPSPPPSSSSERNHNSALHKDRCPPLNSSFSCHIILSADRRCSKPPPDDLYGDLARGTALCCSNPHLVGCTGPKPAHKGHNRPSAALVNWKRDHLTCCVVS